MHIIHTHLYNIVYICLVKEQARCGLPRSIGSFPEIQSRRFLACSPKRARIAPAAD